MIAGIFAGGAITRVLWRLAPWAALGLVLVVGGLYVRAVRSEAALAASDLANKTAELEAIIRNQQVSEQLVAEDILRVRTQKEQAVRLMEKYRHAPKPVPIGCESVLDPVRDAALIVRELRLGSGGVSTPSHPADVR